MVSQRKISMKAMRGVLAVALLALVPALVFAACSDSDSAGDGATGTSGQQSEQPAALESVIAEGEDLVINVGEITETASFYPVGVDGTQMEIVAVKAPDGTIRTAFNTCQVCYDSGRGYYKQSGDMLVCQNCGNQFPMSSVEIEAGGCNPWPIFAESKTVTDETITITNDFLKESKAIFANWGRSY